MLEHNKRRYDNRRNRLLKLLELNAPKQIVARECLLIASAVFDVPDLMSRVDELVENPDEQLIQRRQEILQALAHEDLEVH